MTPGIQLPVKARVHRQLPLRHPDYLDPLKIGTDFLYAMSVLRGRKGGKGKLVAVRKMLDQIELPRCATADFTRKALGDDQDLQCTLPREVGG